MRKPGSDSDGRALFLTPEAPYPAAGGGALRSASLLEYVARRDAVDVIFFQQPGAPDPAESLPAGLARETLSIALPYHSRGAFARAERNFRRFLRGVPPLTDRFAGFGGQMSDFLAGRRYELAVIEHFWCAPYLESIAPHAANVILDLHNVESVLHGRAARSESWPRSMLLRRFEQASLELERHWLPRFAAVLAASEDDAKCVRTIAPAAKAYVYPNTIPFVPLPAVEKSECIIFTGNMEYHPNIGAVRYFNAQVWPLLRESHPDLSWSLAGKNPQAVARFVNGDPRVRLVGPVRDAIEAIAGAKVAVVPLLAGSGTRFKILEAWAAGVPVVSTTIGAEGLGCRAGEHLLIADTPADFAAAVGRLLGSPDLASSIARAGRALYEAKYTHEAGWRELERLLIF